LVTLRRYGYPQGRHHGDARVHQGIHFRTADVQAAKLGRDVARWVAENYFQPVD
jgi:hypothetical protein